MGKPEEVAELLIWLSSQRDSFVTGAFFYNALGVPVAMGLLFPLFGLLLSPLIAGVAMAFSSVTIMGNANRLRGVKPKFRVK